jgi:hypothetical protein
MYSMRMSFESRPVRQQHNTKSEPAGLTPRLLVLMGGFGLGSAVAIGLFGYLPSDRADALAIGADSTALVAGGIALDYTRKRLEKSGNDSDMIRLVAGLGAAVVLAGPAYVGYHGVTAGPTVDANDHLVYEEEASIGGIGADKILVTVGDVTLLACAGAASIRRRPEEQ